MFFLFFFILFAFTHLKHNNHCHGKENNVPFFTSPPILQKTIKNAKLYTVGDKSENSTWNIVHLYGNDYDMGLAYGTIMSDEVSSYVDFFVNFIEQYVDKHFEKFPKIIRQWIEKHGLWYVLDWVYDITKKYTPTYFWDFVKGLSDGANVDYLTYRRSCCATQLVEMTKCTVFGAWDEGTPSGKLLHVRGLDLEFNDLVFPLMQSPTIAVHHYNDSESETVINICTAGYVGSLTGVSSRMSFGSKEWHNTRHSELPLPGIIANFASFHALRYAKDFHDVVKSMVDTKRTLATFAGVGDYIANDFIGIEYQTSNVSVYTWNNQSVYEPTHPRFKKVVYWDKEDQPSLEQCFGELLTEYYGNFTSDTMIRKILPVVQTGDVTSAVFDFSDKQIYLAWGLEHKAGYDKQYVKLDLNKLLDEKQ